jgi:chorismate mutase
MFRRTAEMATKATEYKAKRGLFDLRPPIREKAIANRVKRAHRKSMHNNGVDPELFAKDIWA